MYEFALAFLAAAAAVVAIFFRPGPPAGMPFTVLAWGSIVAASAALLLLWRSRDSAGPRSVRIAATILALAVLGVYAFLLFLAEVSGI